MKKDFILTINHRFCFNNEKEVREAWFSFQRLLRKYHGNIVMEVFNHLYEPGYGLRANIKGKEIMGFIPKNKIKQLKKQLGINNSLCKHITGNNGKCIKCGK